MSFLRSSSFHSINISASLSINLFVCQAIYLSVCPYRSDVLTSRLDQIHLAVKPFICEICNHGFTRAAHYESHVAKHKGLKTHR